MSPSKSTAERSSATSATQRRLLSAEERARFLREVAAKRTRRHRAILFTVVAVGVTALVLGVGIAIQQARSDAAAAAAGPPGLAEYGGWQVGTESAPVRVTEYIDFMCPACKQFEDTTAGYLDDLRDTGEIAIEYVPVAILDRLSEGTEYSTRSAGAAYCLAEHDPDLIPAFTAAMYDSQPGENTPGLDQQTISGIADAVGAGQPTLDCIGAQTYDGYAAAVTDRASKEGLSGTPTVRVNGAILDSVTLQNLMDAIERAAG